MAKSTVGTCVITAYVGRYVSTGVPALPLNTVGAGEGDGAIVSEAATSTTSVNKDGAEVVGDKVDVGAAVEKGAV